jgi:FlaA1/EpsC-like NDP-sugar epimerase
MRPGEKMEEALWEEDAVVEPTAHQDILRVTESERSNGADLRQAVQSLELAAETGDRFSVEAVLCEWIPTFSPSVPLLPRDLSPARDYDADQPATQ